ncbi:MAG: hypothetical protein LBC87_05425 [Fibromonadaceae bacterium]|jgi:uncharacterized protein (TIGR02145 family)|nr:hypothetical protein [Fibromonadaceae bacterium]
MNKPSPKVIYVWAIFTIAVIIIACGPVGDSGSADSSSSQTYGETSSDSNGSGGNSSNENTTCQGICCNGAPYDNTKNFCVENQLYPLCNGRNYNPYEQGCFGNKLYPKCSIESTRGICVDNSLLRCRQEGKGDKYIKDPLVGMKCEANGKIVGKTKDKRDGKEYNIAQIGRQIWLAENLNYKTSEPLNKGVCYGENASNCDKYGILYDWATAMSLTNECNYTDAGCPPEQGVLWGAICPPDFYIPGNEDWQELIDYAGGDSIAGSRLKSTSGWNSNGNGTDSYGFNALPGGYYYEYTHGFSEGPDDKENKNSIAMWWANTQHPKPDAYYWTVISYDTEARNNFQSKGPHKAYVRCLHYF